MEDEKKIIAPKGRKTASTSKKKLAPEKETAPDDILELGDSVGEIKPARKPRITTKKIAAEDSASAVETKQKETKKIVEAYEAQPKRRRKTVAKEDENSDSGKIVSKPSRKRSSKSSIVSETLETTDEAEKLAQIGASTNFEELSSPEIIDEPAESVSPENEAEDPLAGKSPVFRELAQPKLPDLQPENRAWLQMQSPTRIFFYWSLKTNPFETLQKVFGGRNGNYTLSVKLQNLTKGTEKIYPLAPYGSAWFDVESNAEFRAEVGFYDPQNPFIRLVYSNTLETPRLSPSPRADWSPQFSTTARQYAEVLDVSGYKQDAFEMALAGDDLENANTATFSAFEQLIGEDSFEIDPAELRLVLFALASGLSLEDLRGQISPQFFAYLEKLMRENPAALAAENILAILQKHFGLGTLETEDEDEEITYSVAGASLINFKRFPKQFWKKLSPLSSQRISS